MPDWYTITYRGTAEMTVRVLADSPEDARQRAEDGDYEDESDIQFLKGRPYTTKVRRMAQDES